MRTARGRLQEGTAQLPAARTDHEKTALQRPDIYPIFSIGFGTGQIDAVDRQIDQLVYELYGLTEEEIAIVEAGAE